MLHPRCLWSCWRRQGHIGVCRRNLIFAYLMIQRRLMDFRIRVGGNGTTCQSRLQLIIEYFNLEFKRQEHVSRSTRHARRSADAGSRRSAAPARHRRLCMPHPLHRRDRAGSSMIIFNPALMARRYLLIFAGRCGCAVQRPPRLEHAAHIVWTDNACISSHPRQRHQQHPHHVPARWRACRTHRSPCLCVLGVLERW